MSELLSELQEVAVALAVVTTPGTEGRVAVGGCGEGFTTGVFWQETKRIETKSNIPKTTRICLLGRKFCIKGTP